MEPLIREWLGDFKSVHTQRVYRRGLEDYQHILGFQNWETYLNGGDYVEDLRKFAESLNGRAPNTVLIKVTAVRSFLKDKEKDIDNGRWRRLVKRGFIPRKEPITRDRIPTKEELARILTCSNTMLRAIVLFAISSGCRVGEISTLRLADCELDYNPPRAFLRGEATKNHRGRTVYMSREAADAIKAWLTAKTKKRKKNGAAFDPAYVFGVSVTNIQTCWKDALIRSEVTDKCQTSGTYRCHFHTLRKFFRTNIGLSPEYVEYLLGHSMGMDNSYFRPYEVELEKLYTANMHRVSVFEGNMGEVGEELDRMKQENENLRKKVETLSEESSKVRNLERQMKAMETLMDAIAAKG